MDLYIEQDIDVLSKIFEKIGFKIYKRSSYMDAIFWQGLGRYHIHYGKFEDLVYCDLHFDKMPHFLFFRVDFKEKPKIFFKEKIEHELKSRNISVEVKECDWFTRKNNSIFWGFKL